MTASLVVSDISSTRIGFLYSHAVMGDVKGCERTYRNIPLADPREDVKSKCRLYKLERLFAVTIVWMYGSID